ncbi:MAG: hypothetical protein A2806_02885 [Candidatus Terrybacteria bacterium RIFCSPHIGHO2_01_FULL_48_17]|uniref:Uncharacterized protein n=1 Tax=Candidatus Terrybacteria bacterium RIFCSPHIGHO2_01_FULL_48_17 TaxID=1802362 RepID=A0A1G2PL73_9BACT|nr:MAG: hypothetical protein A2806_02885 [Candidatus Terrybacteria bacterium RIFCSPHIGHO2_01_FULL_48_17]
MGDKMLAGTIVGFQDSSLLEVHNDKEAKWGKHFSFVVLQEVRTGWGYRDDNPSLFSWDYRISRSWRSIAKL